VSGETLPNFRQLWKENVTLEERLNVFSKCITNELYAEDFKQYLHMNNQIEKDGVQTLMFGLFALR
jgi:hypothetical protein